MCNKLRQNIYLLFVILFSLWTVFAEDDGLQNEGNIIDIHLNNIAMDTVNDEDQDAPSLHDLAVDTLGGESTIMPISIDIVDGNEVELVDDAMPEEFSPVRPTPSTFILGAVEEVPSTSVNTKSK